MNSLQPWLVSFATAVALAAVALVAYTVGRRPWRMRGKSFEHHGEVDRALAVAKELESVAARINSALSLHSRTVATFGRRLKRMERALSEYVVQGIKTNIPFHKAALVETSFVEGAYDTRFVERLLASETGTKRLRKAIEETP